MKRTALAALVIALAAAPAQAWQPAPGFEQRPLWPGAGPHAVPLKRAETDEVVRDKLVAGKPWVSVENVTRPTMTVYPAKGANTGAAVVVCPGGGYMILAIDLEGTEVCDWLTSRGITAVLLKYRVPGQRRYPKAAPHYRSGPYPRSPIALSDAQRAIRLVRANAAKWGIDPRKIGTLGFSAGGHLSAATAMEYDRPVYKPVDAVDKLSCRPDFAVPIYPGHLWDADKPFSTRAYVRVHAGMPPICLIHAQDDPVDDVSHSLTFFHALKKAQIPTELHVYATGGHAFGLRPSKHPITGWPKLVETWLATIGMT